MNNKKPFWGSLKTFTWSNKPIKSDTEILIENTLCEWFSAKHRKTSKEEIKWLNNLSPSSCPFCHSTSIIKDGFKKSKLQMYRCKTCSHRFNILTNTIFDSHKIPLSEWAEFLLHLFEFHSINSSSRDNRNANSTGKYWLFKVFEVLKHYQDNIVLKNNIWLDETFLSKKQSDLKLISGKQPRGISSNKLCIGVACDYENVYIAEEKTSKPSLLSTRRTFINHIKPGSCLVHDEEHSHSILVKELKLSEKTYLSNELKKLKDNKNPLNRVNKIHYYIKLFFKEHNGFNRDELQDWCNLLSFILNPPHNRYEKIIEFIEIAILCNKKLRYRDVMSKKAH